MAWKHVTFPPPTYKLFECPLYYCDTKCETYVILMPNMLNNANFFNSTVTVKTARDAAVNFDRCRRVEIYSRIARSSLQ